MYVYCSDQLSAKKHGKTKYTAYQLSMISLIFLFIVLFHRRKSRAASTMAQTNRRIYPRHHVPRMHIFAFKDTVYVKKVRGYISNLEEDDISLNLMRKVAIIKKAMGFYKRSHHTSLLQAVKIPPVTHINKPCNWELIPLYI